MATVDDLLRRMHRQAAGLPTLGQPSRLLEAHQLAWMPLATNARRVLESLDPRPDQDPEFYGLLQSLSLGRHTSAGQAPDPDLTALALTVGALGDMVNGFPEIVADVGQAQRTRAVGLPEGRAHPAAHAVEQQDRGVAAPSLAAYRLRSTTSAPPRRPPIDRR